MFVCVCVCVCGCVCVCVCLLPVQSLDLRLNGLEVLLQLDGQILLSVVQLLHVGPEIHKNKIVSFIWYLLIKPDME